MGFAQKIQSLGTSRSKSGRRGDFYSIARQPLAPPKHSTEKDRASRGEGSWAMTEGVGKSIAPRVNTSRRTRCLKESRLFPNSPVGPRREDPIWGTGKYQEQRRARPRMGEKREHVTGTNLEKGVRKLNVRKKSVKTVGKRTGEGGVPTSRAKDKSGAKHRQPDGEKPKAESEHGTSNRRRTVSWKRLTQKNSIMEKRQKDQIPCVPRFGQEVSKLFFPGAQNHH